MVEMSIEVRCSSFRNYVLEKRSQVVGAEYLLLQE